MSEDMGFDIKTATLKEKIGRCLLRYCFSDNRALDEILKIVETHNQIAYDEPPICTEIRIMKAFNGG